MHDSAGDEKFTVDHRGGRFQGLGFGAYAENLFDYVKATKHEGGIDTLDVLAVDYLFEQSGDWIYRSFQFVTFA